MYFWEALLKRNSNRLRARNAAQTCHELCNSAIVQIEILLGMLHTTHLISGLLNIRWKVQKQTSLDIAQIPQFLFFLEMKYFCPTKVFPLYIWINKSFSIFFIVFFSWAIVPTEKCRGGFATLDIQNYKTTSTPEYSKYKYFKLYPE